MKLFHQKKNINTGTLILSQDTQRYELNHGLGEVPSLFFIGMKDVYSTLKEKTYLFIGAWGYSDVDVQYRITSSSPSSAPSGNYHETSITKANNKTSLLEATSTTITLCTELSSVKLIGGATYYWIAVGSEVF